MSIKDKIGSLLGGGLIKDVSEAIEPFIPTVEKKAEAKAKILDIVQEYDSMIQEQVSARHERDMNSDSWLSKNIRPMCLIFLIVVVSIFAITDGNIGGFTVDSDYIALYKSLLIMTFSFYYGSRGAEKIIQTINKKK